MEKEKLEILTQYSRGEIRRFDVMNKLDMSYSEVLRNMEKYKMPMFELPEDKIKKMVDEFTVIMKGKL